jgi:hypothetical protein
VARWAFIVLREVLVRAPRAKNVKTWGFEALAIEHHRTAVASWYKHSQMAAFVGHGQLLSMISRPRLYRTYGKLIFF